MARIQKLEGGLCPFSGRRYVALKPGGIPGILQSRRTPIWRTSIHIANVVVKARSGNVNVVCINNNEAAANVRADEIL